jgi:micrococcal nuclease
MDPELLKCSKKTPNFSFDGQTFVCKCVSVYDGDTITVAFKPYSTEYFKFHIRLAGIDTPEVRTKNPEEKKQGLLVRDFLRKLILDKLVIIKCGKFDKYGRLLADVFQYDKQGKEMLPSINDLLIEKKYAYSYDGGTKQPFKQN